MDLQQLIEKCNFRHDHFGKLQRVNWSHFARDSHLDCDLENVEELYKVEKCIIEQCLFVYQSIPIIYKKKTSFNTLQYKAMRAFDDIMNDPKNHIRLKMQPGDMVTVKV